MMAGMVYPLQAETHVPCPFGHFLRNLQRPPGGLPALLQEQVHFVGLQLNLFPGQFFRIPHLQLQGSVHGLEPGLEAGEGFPETAVVP